MRDTLYRLLNKGMFLLIFLYLFGIINVKAYDKRNHGLIDSLVLQAQSLPDSSKKLAANLLNMAFDMVLSEVGKDSCLIYYLKIGNAFSEHLDQIRALEILNLGLGISVECSDSIRILEFKEAIGFLYHKRADYTIALNYFVEALNISESIKDTIKIANVCDQIAVILKEQAEHRKALEYFNRSYELRTKINDDTGQVASLISIADLNALLKEYDKAISIYQDCEQLAIKLSLKTDLSRIYSNMGNCFLIMKNYPKAEELFLKGIKIKEEIGDKYRLAIAYNNLSIFYKRINKLDAAYSAANKALNLSKEVSAAYIEMSCYLNLSHYFKLKKDFEKAYDFQRQYANLKDSLFNDSKATQLAEIREKYEAEKKEQQIEILEVENKTQEVLINKNRIIRNVISFSGVLFLLLALLGFYAYKQKKKANAALTEKNKKINDQNIELDTLNNTKNKLFSIIAHDLRSPLSSLDGISDLIEKLLKQGKKEQILKLASHIDQSVSNVNTLLDNLLNWALSQIKRLHLHFEKIGVFEIVNHSIKIHSETAKAKDIYIKNNIEGEQYVNADLNLLRTIFRNLLSNAIKFSPPGSTIEIGATREEGMIKINVTDHGVGIDEEDLESIFEISGSKSKEGTKGEKGSGLGLMLCKEFVILNKGEIMIESKPGQGTKVSFTLPIYS